MTYSIIAHDPYTGALGAATATGSVAVGGFVLHARFGAGVLATQGAFTNWLYGERGLTRMAEGQNAESVRDSLISDDEGASQRQIILCDARGGAAGHTGRANLAHKAHHCEDCLALAGNMLASDDVLPAMHEAFEGAASLPLHERLLQSLFAGEMAGGDARGTHSAAIKVVYADAPPVDLRVDWADAHCIDALWQVYEKTQKEAFQAFLAGVPTLAHPTKTGHVSKRSIE